MLMSYLYLVLREQHQYEAERALEVLNVVPALYNALQVEGRVLHPTHPRQTNSLARPKPQFAAKKSLSMTQ